MESQSHTEVIEAPIAVCFAAVTDFERYPEWFSGISASEVVESDADAGIWTVRYQLDMIVKTIRYTLHYESEPPVSLVWKSVDGDIRAIEGCYRFEQLEPDLTEATCTQSVDVGFWIPGPLKRTFEKSALGDSVRELKAAAERLARA
jgi:ribosome-associated toxin RatA of RatAB toxin-antitoxin module